MATMPLDPLLCPLCGQKKRANALMCASCYQVYRKKAVELLLGGKAVNPRDWIKGEIESRLTTKQEELTAIDKSITDLSSATREAAAAEIRGSIPSGYQMPAHVIQETIRVRTKELWDQKNGNHLWFQKKTLEGQVERLKKALEELSKQKAGDEEQEEPEEDPAVDNVLAAISTASAGEK